MVTFKQFYIAEAGLRTAAPHVAQAAARALPSREKESKALNVLQGALDIAGIEPTVGILADGTNSLISLLRAAAAKTPDVRNKHFINAGISAISLIPFADLIKFTKLRHISKPLTKSAIAGARAVKAMNTASKFASKTAFKGAVRGVTAARRFTSSD